MSQHQAYGNKKMVLCLIILEDRFFDNIDLGSVEIS